MTRSFKLYYKLHAIQHNKMLTDVDVDLHNLFPLERESHLPTQLISFREREREPFTIKNLLRRISLMLLVVFISFGVPLTACIAIHTCNNTINNLQP